MSSNNRHNSNNRNQYRHSHNKTRNYYSSSSTTPTTASSAQQQQQNKRSRDQFSSDQQHRSSSKNNTHHSNHSRHNSNKNNNRYRSHQHNNNNNHHNNRHNNNNNNNRGKKNRNDRQQTTSSSAPTLETITHYTSHTELCNVYRERDATREHLFYNCYIYRIIQRKMNKKIENNDGDSDNEWSDKNFQSLDLPPHYQLVTESEPDRVDHWIQTHIFSQFDQSDESDENDENDENDNEPRAKKRKIVSSENLNKNDDKNDNNMNKELFVGIDCEWDPFRVLYDGQVVQSVKMPDVITIATTKSCLLYKLYEGHVRPSSHFLRLMSDRRVTKVWYDYSNDFQKLNHWIGVHHETESDENRDENESDENDENENVKNDEKCSDVVVNNGDDGSENGQHHRNNHPLVELLKQSSFDLHQLGRNGINSLCKQYLNRMLKTTSSGNSGGSGGGGGARLERWSRVTLSKQQVEYACRDAFANFKIYEQVIHGKRSFVPIASSHSGDGSGEKRKSKNIAIRDHDSHEKENDDDESKNDVIVID